MVGGWSFKTPLMTIHHYTKKLFTSQQKEKTRQRKQIKNVSSKESPLTEHKTFCTAHVLTNTLSVWVSLYKLNSTQPSHQKSHLRTSSDPTLHIRFSSSFTASPERKLNKTWPPNIWPINKTDKQTETVPPSPERRN